MYPRFIINYFEVLPQYKKESVEQLSDLANVSIQTIRGKLISVNIVSDYRLIKNLETLESLRTLRKLVLSTKVYDFDKLDHIQHLKQLRELTFDSFLRGIPASISKLTKLKKLSISSKAFSLPESLGRLTNLESLSLTDNELEWLPDSIFSLPLLKSLNISNNNIHSLGDLSNLVNLKDFYCSNNDLSEISINNPKIEILDMSMNRIRFFKFEDISRLISIDFSHNPIQSIDLTLASNLEVLNAKDANLLFLKVNPSKISEINASTNELEQIPVELNSAPLLRKLNLSKNLIHEISDSFLPPNLLELNLSSNNLSIIPENICKIPKLCKLSLSKNNLKELPLSISKMKNLEYLDVSGNNIPRKKLEELFNSYIFRNSKKKIKIIIDPIQLQIDNKNIETVIQN